MAIKRNARARGAAQRRALQQARRRRQAQRSKPKLPSRPARTRRNIRAASSAKTSASSPELKSEAASVRRGFDRLSGQVGLQEVYSAINSLDEQLRTLPMQLDELRGRGYVHSGLMDEQLDALDEQWDELQPRVEQMVRRQVALLDRHYDRVEQTVDRLAGAATKAGVERTQRAVKSLQGKVDSAESTIAELYKGIKGDLYKIEAHLRQVDWMLDRMEEAADITLRPAEGPLKATKAIWRQSGDEGPEGILYLSDQRLLFEQREEVVTKKRFGIFKSESKEVQQLLLEVMADHIETVSAERDGGFLGMGKAELLTLGFSPDAPTGRVQFEVQGSRSEDWVQLIKNVMSGVVDDDRDDDSAEDVDETEALAADFPAQCPSCFAPVPEVQRGTISVTCEYCSSVIRPDSTE